MLAYGLRRLDPEAARDVTSETFLVAWRRWRRVPEAPLPWLLATARRVLANEVRRQRRVAALSVRVAADPAEILTMNTDLRAALARLSAMDRELLMLVAWEGLSAAEAAGVVGCSAVASRVRLHRARLRLSEALETLRSTVAGSHVRVGSERTAE